MKLQKENGRFTLFMDESDLRSLITMIKGACLPERRHWNNVKQQIEKMID
jgi:hypothetical protein